MTFAMAEELHIAREAKKTNMHFCMLRSSLSLKVRMT